MSSSFRIGIAGLGTVGTGVVKALQGNAALIAARAGKKVEIIAVSARNKNKKRGFKSGSFKWVDKPEDLMKFKPDAVVELIGGSDGPAKRLVEGALKRGVNVVTANKALIAHNGAQLAALAEKNGASLMFEASVAGGIPIIKALREGFAGNRISAVYGILNGTCNYILTQMRETGRPFAAVLKEAQAKGYAEADPGFDIDGIDAGHKLCILTALAFGAKPDLKALEIAGIRNVSALDIDFARELGYRIKLLGIARQVQGKVMQAVEPCLVPQDSPIGVIEGVNNAVCVMGDFVDAPLLTGRGAGEGPTASAVVADIIDIARGLKIPAFGVPATSLKKIQPLDRGASESRYYLRMTVRDVPGVIAAVGAILRDQHISVESLVQRGRDPNQPVSVVLITHHAKRADMLKACAMIAKLKVTVDEPRLIRIEEF